MKAVKKILNNIFIDGLSGMALGLVFHFDHRNHSETDR